MWETNTLEKPGVTSDERTGTSFVPTYRSGTAARLAGIPVETLRVRERRYGVVGPGLNPRGHRQYSTEDVSRLALIKQLVDLGNPIGSIATLPFQRAARDGAAFPTLVIVATCAQADGASEVLRGISADVLAIELPMLQIEALPGEAGATTVSSVGPNIDGKALDAS
jgi:DNA-binding transcriptional MerR regulator